MPSADLVTATQDPGVPRSSQSAAPGRRGLARVAAVLGVLSAILAVAVPFLPVVERTAVLSWPTAAGVAPVSAPLTSYRPVTLAAEVPCAVARGLGTGVLVSTVPTASTLGATTGLFLRVEGGTIALATSGRELPRTPLPADPAADAGCAVTVSSDASRTTLTVGGQTVRADGDVRPQVVGVYSDLPAETPTDGLSVELQADTRYQTAAHPIKRAAGIASVVLLVGCLLALRQLDRRTGRRGVRLVPRGWWRPRVVDVAVFAVLATWLAIGALTSDDGYIAVMARARDESGYVGNYFRWFDVPEAPFGWFYEIYALLVQVSTAGPWLRLPAAAMGMLCWLLISREVLPRLGREVRRSRAAEWAAAAMLMCFWLPFNNGLRPEPVVALGSLLTLCAVERTVATRRLLPAALGILAAGMTFAASPTGVIAILPFLVAGKPLLALVRRRAAEEGWLAVVVPILASGLVVLVAVFADQTFASVREATAVRTAIGPTLSWYEEWTRYRQLFDPGAGGGVPRRFPVFVLLLCVATCLVVLLRRSRIPGAALGPSQRLIGTTAGSVLALAVTPTKWTHHFGAFAALGAALAALTALATGSSVLRSRRNRAAFVAGLLAVAAFAFTGSNTWFYVSRFGVPWSEETPRIGGVSVSTMLLVAAGIAVAVAAVEHLRFDPEKPLGPRPQPRRVLRFASAPLAVLCGLMMASSIASAATGVIRQWPAYSLGATHLTHFSGGGCGLSDEVLVEPEPLAGVLEPVPGSEPEAVGFARDALPVPGSEELERDRVRGERAPYGFGGAGIPLFGTYVDAGRTVGSLRSAWHVLPERARAGESPVVVAAAGAVTPETSVALEFGRGGTVVASIGLADMAENAYRSDPSDWRDLRAILSGEAATADAVRVVALDSSLAEWVAVSAPRVPLLTPLTDLVGPDEPVYLHWTVGFVHPCLRPFGVRDGMSEMPDYAVSGLTGDLPGAVGWASASAGGPHGWLDVATIDRELPTFLRGDWNRDWGHVYQIVPFVAGAGPPVVTSVDVVRSGLYTPGPTKLPDGVSP